jgi:serine/threonine protein kinase
MMAADVWSLACVMGEVLSDERHPLFCGDGSVSQARLIGMALGPIDARTTQYYETYANNVDAFDSILEGSSQLPCAIHDDPILRSVRSLTNRGVPALAVDLLQKMLTYDPRTRISAEAVMAHPFFEGLTTEGPKSVHHPNHPNHPTQDALDVFDAASDGNGSMRWSSNPEQARQRVRQSLKDCNAKLSL